MGLVTEKDSGAQPDEASSDPWRARRSPLALALAAAGLMLALAGAGHIAVLLSRSFVIPSGEQRFDITRVQVAPMSAVCIGAETTLTIDAFERCVSDPEAATRLAAMPAMAIPAVDQTFSGGTPQFVEALEGVRNTAALDAIRNRQPYVVSFVIPGRWFSDGGIGAQLTSLVMQMMYDARVCISGRCSNTATWDHSSLLYIPLIDSAVSDATKESREATDRRVWVFALDRDRPIGMLLSSGVFAAKDRDLRLARRMLPVITSAPPIVYALLFIGLFLLAGSFGLFWREFPDYAALAYFAAAYAFATAPVTHLIIRPFMPSYVDRVFVDAFQEAHVVVALAVLAMTLARWSTRSVLTGWLITFAATSLAIVLMLPADEDLATRGMGHLRLAWTFLMAIVPMVILGIVAIRLNGIPVQIELPGIEAPGKDRAFFASAEEKKARQRQNFIYLGVFAVIGVQFVSARLVQSIGELFAGSTPAIVATIGMFALFATMVHNSTQVLRRRVRHAQRSAVAAARDTAVARTIQMVAHDVRKPFSLMRMTLEALINARGDAELRRLAQAGLVEVDRTLASADSMLQDIMDIGRQETREVVQLPPVTIVEAALGDVFRLYPDAYVALDYAFAHSRAVIANPEHVHRVVTNILNNAVEAMQKRGKITITTRNMAQGKEESASSFVKFSFHNTGSFIDAGDVAKVFDVFFTQNKRGGTGLGLAVAKKLVEASGGTIGCSSDRKTGTTFWFTLPAATSVSTELDLVRIETLPRSSKIISDRYRAGNPTGDPAKAATSVERQSPMTSQRALERAFLDAMKRLESTSPHSSRVRVLAIDDEPIYRNLVSALIEADPLLSRFVELTVVDGSVRALEAARQMPPDLVLTDVDMGQNSLDGHALTRELLMRHPGAVVCVHTNRNSAATATEAAASGARHYLPKPLSRQQLLRIVGEAAQSRVMTDTQAKQLRLDSAAAAGNVNHAAQETLFVIDDDPFTLDAWQVLVPQSIELISAASLPKLADLIQQFLARAGARRPVAAIVTDWYLGGEAVDLAKLADLARLLSHHGESVESQSHRRIPILVCSDAPEIASVAKDLIDGIIPKSLAGWTAVAECIRAARSKTAPLPGKAAGKDESAA